MQIGAAPLKKRHLVLKTAVISGDEWSVLRRHCPGQCYGPTGGENYDQGQDHVPDLDICKETLDEVEVHAGNSHEESQTSCENSRTVKQSDGRLNKEGLADVALREGKRCCGHPTTHARQAGPLLESAVSEVSAHIDFIMCDQGEGAEVCHNRQADNCRYHPLAKRCRMVHFHLI